MPSVRKHQAASVQGRMKRAKAASMPAADQRRGRQRKDDREADIAEIEQRRMDGEAGVLQDRVEVSAFDRRRRQPRERVGRQQDEQQEGGAEHALHRKRVGEQARRNGARKRRHRARR